MTLLTVDWDYFFPTPNPTKFSEQTMLYDWGQKEAPFFMGDIWYSRAQNFLINDLPLPTVNDEWRTFWDRFTIHPEAVLYFSDSHLFAGTELVMFNAEGGHVEVWLYDAHHDSGYGRTLKAFRESGRMDCSDWMLNYRLLARKASLHVRYPTWKPWAMEIEPKPRISLDRQVDDLTTPPVVFDTIHVCRSSAWVPPWCDDLFHQFMYSAPVSMVEEVQPLFERTFDADAAARQTVAVREMMDRASR